MIANVRFSTVSKHRVAGVAPAKLNLFLEITGRRPNGYHELLSVFHEIDLADEIEVEFANNTDRLELTGRTVAADFGENLVIQAVRAFRDHYSKLPPVHLRLHKQIPPKSGLGGGSSNAAFTLAALSALVPNALTSHQLHSIARSLGADIPFFLHGGTAVCRGIGDEIEPVEGVIPRPFLLVRPNFSLSTAEVYGRVRLTESVSDVMPLLGWLRGNPGDGDVSFVNRLQSAAYELRPELGDLQRWLAAKTKSQWCMTGSGSVLFSSFQSQDETRRAGRTVAVRDDLEVFRVASFGGGMRDHGPYLGEGVKGADH